MKKALYFMPDISGFTKFVNNTEMEHSVHIISELLEILIDQNTIGLELVEIEGDALFMYTTDIPDFEVLINQTNAMLRNFHLHTAMYDKKRICNCGSCKTAVNLKLKFLVHYGDLFFMQVKEFTKPYGRDVIKIHRLLKNKIQSDQYLLLTKEAFNLYKENFDDTWLHSSEIHDQKNLEYFYKNLEFLKNKTDSEFNSNDISDNDISEPKLVIEKTFNANIDVIFKYLSDFRYRKLWNKEIDDIVFNQNKINRIGVEHKCILKLGNLNFKTISIPDSESLIYGEKTKDVIFTKDFYYLVKLDEINESTTHVTVSFFIEFTFIGSFLKKGIINNISKVWNKMLDELHDLSKRKSIKIEA
jgi:hypothetical protein